MTTYFSLMDSPEMKKIVLHLRMWRGYTLFHFSISLVAAMQEEKMERRLLCRNQGRVEDNIETIRKRPKVFVESSLPVVEYYGSKNKVRKIDVGKPIAEVFASVKTILLKCKKNMNRCRCMLAEIVVEAVVVADLERRDVNSDLIKVEGKLEGSRKTLN